MGSSKQSQRRLYEIASDQQGFFTAQQAKKAGYQDTLHGYHVRNGDWEKAARGVYRLAQFPASSWPELVIWWLWSRGRNDEPQGVFSHQTALQIHGLLPRDPSRLHLTVPVSFRRGIPIPGQLILHMEDLPEEAIEQREGYRVTTRTRAEADVRGVAPPPAPYRPEPKPARAKAPAQPPPRRSNDWAVWE